MDLTRLYNLTTPELREEAERLGVDDTYAMSRGQLIHAIRDKSTGPKEEGFLGKVFGFAKWALQAAGETTSGRAAPVSVEAAASVPEPLPASEPESAPASEPESASAPEPASAPAPESAPAPASASEPASAPEPAPVLAPASASEPVPGSEPAPASEAVSSMMTDTGPPSRPPAGVFSNSVGLFEEPFPTRTMARILADQGHYKRSLAIYARLLNDEPGNPELSAEADAVRAQARTRRSHAPH